MTTERNISLDILRIIACLGVIGIHTAGSPICHGMVEQGTLWYNECLIMDALVRWSVPVFAMLTGYFLLDSKKELPIKKLITKYILRIVVALIVWSAFYAITLHKPLLPFGSQEGHFWYLGMVIGLYLSLPILRMIVANKTILFYFCWTWLFFMCYRFVGNFYTLPIALDNVLFVNYAGYALWGVYCKELLPKINRWICIAITGGGRYFNNLRCGLDAKRRQSFYGLCFSKCYSYIHTFILFVRNLRLAANGQVATHNPFCLGMLVRYLPNSHMDSDSGVLPCISLCGATYSAYLYMRKYGLCRWLDNNLYSKENPFYQ